MIRIAVAVLAASALAPAAASAQGPVEIDAGGGSKLRVERSPFRIVLLDRAGREVVATVAGREGPPVRVPGLDGPQPIEPLGGEGGYPALGFVVGPSTGVTFPVGFFSGNRLFGAEAGALVSVTGVDGVTPLPGGGARLELRTDAPSAAPASMTVTRVPSGGVRLQVEPPPNVESRSTQFTLASPRGEGLFGLGARKDSFDQRGLLRNVWVEQQNSGSGPFAPVSGSDPSGTTGPTYTFPNGAQAAYYVQAQLVGARGWSAWVGNTELSRLDLAASRADAVRWGVAAPRLDLFVAGGAGVEDAVRRYTAAVGRAPAPPRWAYEPWIDVINEGEGEAAPNGAGFAGGARVKQDLEDVVKHARDDDIPIGTLGVEGWHVVPDGERFFRGLREQGFALSAYWNPFTAVGTPAYEEALAKGLFIRDPAGQPYPIVTNRGNRSYVLDFSNPATAAFWRAQIDRSNRLGFEGFMHDFGEFVTEGMRFYNGQAPEQMHNAYPVLYHQAARAAVDGYARENPGFDPFFYVRAGYSGIGAGRGVIGSTPSVFPGDETTDFDRGSGLPSVIPAMLNLALGGSYAYTTDVGGYLDLYTPRTTPELLARWSQLAAFTPISRIHNSTGKGTLFPWEAGPETLDVYRRYAKAKVRLIPLVDAYSKRAARTGAVGPVRPLVLEDGSAAATAVDDEWLLGRTLLIAPIVEQGATSRRVYLPAGASWQRMTVAADGRLRAAGAAEAGGRTVTAPAPLADIPVYRRVISARLRVRCSGRTRVSASIVSSDLAGVNSVSFRTGSGRSRSDSAAPFRSLLPAKGRRARATLTVEDGRRISVSRTLPRCGRAAQRRGTARFTG